MIQGAQSLCDDWGEEETNCATDIGCGLLVAWGSYMTGGTCSDSVQNVAQCLGAKDLVLSIYRGDVKHGIADAAILAGTAYFCPGTLTDKIKAGAQAVGTLETAYHTFQAFSERETSNSSLRRRRPGGSSN